MTASDKIDKPVSAADAQYVIKIVSYLVVSLHIVVFLIHIKCHMQEPHSNGPLFVEMNFYMRVAKADLSKLTNPVSSKTPY